MKQLYFLAVALTLLFSAAGTASAQRKTMTQTHISISRSADKYSRVVITTPHGRSIVFDGAEITGTDDFELIQRPVLKHFENRFELTFIPSPFSSNYEAVGTVNYIAGCRFNEVFFFGGGIGLGFMTSDLQAIDNNRFIGSTGCLIEEEGPEFLNQYSVNMSANVLRSRSVDMYLSAAVGFGFTAPSMSCVFLANPGIGIDIKTRRKASFRIGTGFYYLADMDGFCDSLRAIPIQLGISF